MRAEPGAEAPAPGTAAISRRDALRWGSVTIAAATAGTMLAGCLPSAVNGIAHPPALWRGSGAAGLPAQPTSAAGSGVRPRPAARGITTGPVGQFDPVLLGPRSFTPPSFGSVPAAMLPVYTLAQFAARTPGAAPFPHDCIMLTIDDGPDPHWTPKILALLARYHVRATFCVIGRSARAHPALVRAAASEGHLLANHTFSHPARLTGLSDAAIRTQIVDAQDAIVSAAGVTPFQFRSPGGNWSAKLLRQVAADKLTAIDWDVDPRDWSRPGPAQIIARMLAARPGDVLLCHDGGGDRSQTYTALQTVLPQLKARGLQFTVLPAPHS